MHEIRRQSRKKKEKFRISAYPISTLKLQTMLGQLAFLCQSRRQSTYKATAQCWKQPGCTEATFDSFIMSIFCITERRRECKSLLFNFSMSKKSRHLTGAGEYYCIGSRPVREESTGCCVGRSHRGAVVGRTGRLSSEQRRPSRSGI